MKGSWHSLIKKGYTPFRGFVLIFFLQSKSWFFICQLWLRWISQRFLHLLNKRYKAREERTTSSWIPIMCLTLYMVFNSKAILWVALITPILSINKLRSRDIPQLIRWRPGLPTLIRSISFHNSMVLQVECCSHLRLVTCFKNIFMLAIMY